MKNRQNSSRIDVADVLRGIAVIGIILVHTIEHFNFYSFDEATAGQGALLDFTDKAIWNSIFFLFGGKAYALFALLFGFSFFIQESRQRAAGKDFRLRFVWRMALLVVIGCVNSIFYPGDILVMYAVMGLVLPLVCRLPDRAVWWIGVFLLLQPVEWWSMIRALADPAYVLPGGPFDASFKALMPIQGGGTFWEACKTNFTTGQLANLNWYVTYGRLSQTAGLFVMGMLIGRRGLFGDGEKNRRFWFNTICWSAVLFFAAEGLRTIFPDFVENRNVMRPLNLMLRSYANLGVTFALAGGILTLFYTTKLQKVLMTIAPCGRMSLTCYLSQSVIGTAIFYHWGLGLWNDLGVTYSFIVGVGIVAAQLLFCHWWMRTHRQGPVEWLWKRATWVAAK